MPHDESTNPVNRNACQRVAAKNPLLRAARYYTLQLDRPIFPLLPNEKIPATPNGFKDATTEELTICQWWKDNPAANLAMPTGDASGFLVLDIDPKNGGLDSLAKLQAEYEELSTLMVRTPSGGFHYYFKWQHPLTNSNKGLKQYGPGLDVRGEGGYVVIPPSVIDGKHYEWMNEEEAVELPEWLLTLLLPPLSPPKPERSSPNPIERELISVSELLDPRRAKAASTLIERASELTEGERNDGTFRYAAALREVVTTEGEWDTYRARLLDVLPYGNGIGPAFTEAEAERTIRSAEARVVLGAWQPTMPLDQAGAKAVKERLGLQVTWATDIEVKPLEWLWRNYVPLGALGILAGAPKVGKSAVAIDLAARVTTGRPMPDGSPGVKGSVLLLAPEDGPDGAKVRFLAAGGNPALFGVLWASNDVPPTFPDDTAELERLITAHDIRLVVIDNLDAVANRKTEMNKAKDTTEMLAPLQAVAKRTGASILAIEHTRKSSASDPLDSVLGSRKITGVARFVAFVLRDQDNPAERLFGVRGNYAAEDDGTLRFTLQSAGDDARGIQVAWQGSGYVSLADAMLANSEAGDSALDEARRFLRAELANGPVASAVVKQNAKDQDIALPTLHRARRSLKVVDDRIEVTNRKATYWSLPKADTFQVRITEDTNETYETDETYSVSSHNTSTTATRFTRIIPDTNETHRDTRCSACGDWLLNTVGPALCPRCEEEGAA
jgi:hypothetical protein